MTLQDIFNDDELGLLDGPIVVNYRGYTYTDVGGNYTVRKPEGYLMYENIKTIEECRRLIDSNIQWHKEAK